MSTSELPDYVRRNRELWTRSNVEYTDASAREAWAQREITWGMFAVPESELGVLGDVGGLDIVELGCGTAYFSAWLARHGARVVGVDVTSAQLETARRMQAEFGIEFPLIEASAEDVPLPDESFDLVHSEYGASIWCDPARWLPEAARLLRSGGRLVFMRGTPLLLACMPDEGQATERLVRDWWSMYRLDWPGEGVEFHPTHGELIQLLRASGFEVEDLIELQAPVDAETHPYYNHVSAEWARRWPAEEIWVARKQ
jgi:ubiquinone/menaquinone biosynthesis C-methylase UbiE